jgi:hypothetical protein
MIDFASQLSGVNEVIAVLIEQTGCGADVLLKCRAVFPDIMNEPDQLAQRPATELRCIFATPLGNS